MKIAIFDMDGTMTDEVGFLKRYAPDFLRRKYGLRVEEVYPDAYSVSDIYRSKNVLCKENNLERICTEIGQDFWNTFFWKYCNEPIKEGVKELIDFLRDNGYTVQIVSMRGKSTKQNPSWKDVFIIDRIIPWLTKRQLRRNKIKVDKIVFPLTVEEKINYISASNPQLVFEDQTDIIMSLVETLGKTSRVICVDNPYNRELQLGNNVIRIKDYVDKEIQEIKRGVDCKAKQRCRENNIFYRMIKIVGSPFVYMNFRPIICGKQLIPNEKSVAFVGNHRKKSDPIIVTAIVKQTIHWAALYRMFTGGEALFSDTKSKWKCRLSGLFLKIMGAVPIARPEDHDHQSINMNTIRFLTEELKSGKSSVGFFPEGTLNRKFAEQDILPIKSGRIFKLVGVAKGYIQPFSIVWIPPNDVIKNKVIICFSAPINSEGRTVVEINRMWYEALEKNIQKSNNLINRLIEISNSDIKNKCKLMSEEIYNFKHC